MISPSDILHRIENKIEKTGENKECFLHCENTWNQFKKQVVATRSFIVGIFMEDSSTENNQRFYLRCGKSKCVNPNHIVKTTCRVR